MESATGWTLFLTVDVFAAVDLVAVDLVVAVEGDFAVDLAVDLTVVFEMVLG